MTLPANFTLALPAMNSAAAAGGGTDYKALVIVMLAGGCDNHNTVIPTGAAYSAYSTGRGALALADGSNLALADTAQVKLHPNLVGLQTIYAADKMAILANVGQMTVPITKAQWAAGYATVPVPFQLFSHSDQRRQWSTGSPLPSFDTGWGGRTSDLMHAAFNPSATVTMSLSPYGNDGFSEGYDARGYQVLQETGPVDIPRRSSYSGHAAAATALTTLLNGSSTHPLEGKYLSIAQQSVANRAATVTAIGSTTMIATFPTTQLGAQLKMVARLIRGRATLNHRRQIFYCQMDGWDQHGSLLSAHGANLLAMNNAIKAFYDEMVGQGISNTVTLATISDFGRQLGSNGDGSDHGWGAHHFVIGGSVLGGQLYNKATNAASVTNDFPDIALGGPYDAGNGALIPTTSVYEYGATLLKWFGVPDALSNGVNPLDLVFPDLVNFGSRGVGFLP